MKITKRLLGVLLAIVMIVGLIPVVASAEIADGYTTLSETTYSGIRSDAKDVTYLDSTYCTGSYITPASGETEARTPTWNHTWGYGSKSEGKGAFYFRVNNTTTYGITGTSGQGGDLTNGYYRTISNVNYYHSRFYMGNYAAEFANGFGVLPSAASESQQYVLFDLSQLNADYFYSVVGLTGSAFNLKDANNKNNKVKFTVYASPIVTTDAQDESFVTLATSDELLNSASGEFNVFIKGYKTLKLSAAAVTSKNGTDSAWAGACVYNVHTWDDGVETKATCTEAGFKTYSCTDDGCTVTYTEMTDSALGHSYTGENGVCVNGCEKTVCDNEGHSYGEYAAVEGTLTEQSVCSGCGDVQTRWATLTAPELENAESITYLSDVYNTDAKVSHYVQPEHDTDWKLDVNRDNTVFVYVGNTRYQIPKPNTSDETRYLDATGVTYHRSWIVLGPETTVYEKGLSVRPSDVGHENDANVVFDVSNMAGDHFYAVAGMTGMGNDPNKTDRLVDFELWGKAAEGDYVLLYKAEDIRGNKTAVFNVDISAYDYIKLVSITDGEIADDSAVSWADACVYSLAESTCDHAWGEGSVTTAASCRTAGVMTYTCSTCSETKTVSIMAPGHAYESIVTAPTCTEKGYTTHTCASCGDSYVDTYVDVLPVVAQIGEDLYPTVQAAVDAATAADVVKLAANSEEVITVNDGQTLYLDLNGYDLEKVIVINGDQETGGKFYGMDTTTDDYICGEDDYGKIGSIEGTYETAYRTTVTGTGKRYVAVVEDGISFHRFYVGITHMALRPAAGGAGYTMTIAGDQKVQSILAESDAYGYTVSVEINGKTASDTRGGGKADFTDEDKDGIQKMEALTIDNILVAGDSKNAEYAELKVNVSAFIQFNGMDKIEVTTTSLSFKEIVEATDDALVVGNLSDAQKEALIYMYNELGVGAMGWDIPKIQALAEAAA